MESVVVQGRRQRQRAAARHTLCRALPCVTLYDAYDRQVPYEQAWKWQKDMVEAVAASSAAARDAAATSSPVSTHDSAAGAPLGSLVLLQHPPVYTLGTGASEGHLKFDAAAAPLPLYRTERGGEVRQSGGATR
jgi:lipoyl(octanoyl) transferase